MKICEREIVQVTWTPFLPETTLLASAWQSAWASRCSYWFVTSWVVSIITHIFTARHLERQCHGVLSLLVICQRCGVLTAPEETETAVLLSQISPLNRADMSRDPVHGPLGALEILRGRPSIPCAKRMQNYGSRPPKVCNLIAWSKPLSVPFPLTLVISSELFLNLVIWIFSSFLAEVDCFPLKECIIRVWNLIEYLIPPCV